VGSRAIVGFNQAALAHSLNLAGTKAQLVADEKFFETLDHLLEAVIRATRQVPTEHLMWRPSDRDRSLKLFCYHILADPENILESIRTQTYDGTFKFGYKAASESFQHMDEVARFGEETRIRVRQRARTITAEELDRTIDGYSGQTNGHTLLHHVSGHTAHHLLQLYEFLRMIGVEPNDPLTEEDLKGIPKPKKLW
jgi:uncharacterized damage-inducible protein DinB